MKCAVSREAADEAPTLDQLARRGQRVRDQLARTPTVTQAIYEAGFNSSGRFSAAVEGLLGMTPTPFRARGADERIRWAISDSSLGSVLVAATDRGICAIAMGDDPEMLQRDLSTRFPRASFVDNDQAFRTLVARVVALVEAPARAVRLPLDVRGTAFQQRVWEALRNIPAGATASYSDIARTIGLPRAVRGVARACASNTVAVAIPCHRAVRSDGTLAGYRWGLARKRALLAREAAASRTVAK